MEKPNEINYVCARWRDANTDPPPELWVGMVRIIATNGRILNAWFHSDRQYGPQVGREKTQWLDVTNIPAVPRAKVQAAVDEIERKIRVIWRDSTDDNGMCYSDANDIIEKHTGVTPTEE